MTDREIPNFSVHFIYDEECNEWMPHWHMDGKDMGIMGWEMSADGKHGSIDFLDQEHILVEMRLRKAGKTAIAEYMHDTIPLLETVDYHNMQQVFHEAA